MAVDVRDFARELLHLEAPLITLDSALLARLVEQQGLSELEAMDRLDQDLRRLTIAIDSQIAEDREGRITTAYKWDESRRFLIHKDADADDSHVARLIKLRSRILDTLGELSPRQFEHLCGFLLDVYGVPSDQRIVTPPTADGGIDFIGVRGGEARPGGSRLDTLFVRIVGQAKRYSSPVGPDAMAALSARLEDARRESGVAWTKLPDWFKDRNEPIVGMFVASSRFGDDARSSARLHTILAINGVQLSEDLAASGHVAEWCQPGTDEFDQSRFVGFFPE